MFGDDRIDLVSAIVARDALSKIISSKYNYTIPRGESQYKVNSISGQRCIT